MRCRLSDLELDVEIVEIRQRLESSWMQTHRHDLVNALTAVEGATSLMTREGLSTADRSTLVEVVDSGLTHLRRLLFARPDAGHIALAELTAALAAEPAWRQNIQVEVAADPVAAGSPAEVGETIRQILTSIDVRAPGRPVVIRAHRNADRVELWVDADRPQVPHGGRRNESNAVHSLRIAQRLARDQGAIVTVERHPGGGESIGVSWPAYHG